VTSTVAVAVGSRVAVGVSVTGARVGVLVGISVGGTEGNGFSPLKGFKKSRTINIAAAIAARKKNQHPQFQIAAPNLGGLLALTSLKSNSSIFAPSFYLVKVNFTIFMFSLPPFLSLN
jgi:hypothetical protein